MSGRERHAPQEDRAMEITDEMVERVKASIKSAALEMDGDITLGSGRWYEGLALAALTAALGDVEPLESVLGERFTVGEVIPTTDGEWDATVEEWDEYGNHYRTWQAVAPTIDAAIRAAVANAKGGTA